MIIRRMQMEDTVAAAALEAENFSEPWSANSFMEEIKKNLKQAIKNLYMKQKKNFQTKQFLKFYLEFL